MAELKLGKVRGLSAYEIAVQNGYQGTEQEWVAYLKAIDGTRATLNEEPLTNVNFIGNEVIGNALVRNEIITGAREISGLTYKDDFTIFIKLNANNISDFSSEGHFYMLGKLGTSPTSAYLNNGASRVVFKGLIKDVKRLYTNTESIIIIKKDNVFTFNTCDTVTTFELTEQLTNNVFIGGYGSYNFKNNSYFTMSVFDKALTQQEIQHYFSVLNNSPSISSIETTDSTGKTSLLLATKSDLVETRTGHTDEERYTALLGKFGKKFTSIGEDVTVANAIEKQRVLGAKISGQTVKCIYADSDWVTKNSTGYEVANVLKNNCPQVKGNATYMFVVEIKENTRTGAYNFLIGSTTRVINPHNDANIQPNTTGIFKMVVTSKADLTVCEYLFTSQSSSNTDTGTITFRRCLLEISDISLVNGFIPFGLNSTKAIISNNGLKYPFYASKEDKAQGKVIDLGGLGDVADTLEILEDGSAIYKQNIEKLSALESLTLILDKSDDTNTIRFRTSSDGVKNAINYNLMCNNFPIRLSSSGHTDTEYVYLYNNILYINILKSKLTSQDVDGFKSWLQSNPTTVFYQLTTPIITYIDKSLVQAIATEQTNIFSVDSAVKPSGLEVTVAVDKVADLEKRLSQVEALTNTVSVQSAYAEEVYADCLDKLNTL